MEKTMRGDLLQTGLGFAMGIVFIGILLGAGAIAMGTGGMSAGYNSTTSAGQVLGNSSASLLNMSTQMPTIGTISGVGLIILVLFTAIGGYVFSKMQE